MPSAGIIERQVIMGFEEENGFATLPTTPQTNSFFQAVEEFRYTPAFTRNSNLLSSGSRVSNRSDITNRAYTFSLTMETHPKLLGWWLKWAHGNIVTVTSGSQYRILGADVGDTLPSFYIMADTQVNSFWAGGKGVGRYLGCKIGRLRVEADGSQDDKRYLLTIEGISQGPEATATDALTGITGLDYAKTLLYNSVNPTAFVFSGAIVNWDGGGFLSTNDWQRFAYEIQNSLKPISIADNSQSVYIDDIFLQGQQAMIEFDREYYNDALMADFHEQTQRKVQVQVAHKDTIDGSQKYQTEYRFNDSYIIEAGDIMSAGGSDETMVRSHVMEAIEDDPRVDVNNSGDTGTNHVLDLDATTDREAVAFTMSASGAYVSEIDLKLKVTVASQITSSMTMEIYTDNSDEPGTLVPGGTANLVSMNALTNSYQTFVFRFPQRPLLTASTKYWAVIKLAAIYSGTDFHADGDTGGTNSHTASTDSGSTWAAADSDAWWLKVKGDDVQVVIDYRSDGTYPDSA